jgi:hypothetical protein
MRPGSDAGVLYTRWTGPRTGSACSGESITAVPTRELSGHAVAFARSRAQARVSAADRRPGGRQRDLGPVQRRVLGIEAQRGAERWVVSLQSSSGDPSEPSGVGANSSASRPVGASVDVASENADGFR